ncbi:MAG TPA: hypothetical protein VK723_00990 [Thermoplasmata archaeon]|nr:hypothetical protein [Thermoplasmata archaeon]
MSYESCHTCFNAARPCSPASPRKWNEATGFPAWTKMNPSEGFPSATRIVRTYPVNVYFFRSRRSAFRASALPETRRTTLPSGKTGRAVSSPSFAY